MFLISAFCQRESLVFYESQNKEGLFPYKILTDFLFPRSLLLTFRYGLNP